jgi:hypothetical protein
MAFNLHAQLLACLQGLAVDVLAGLQRLCEGYVLRRQPERRPHARLAPPLLTGGPVLQHATFKDEMKVLDKATRLRILTSA